MENNIDRQIIPGDRDSKYICYENPVEIFGATIVSVIDRNANFGIVLDMFEKSTLKKFYDMLSFIIKYQSASGEKLREIVKYLYAVSIMLIMKEEIKNDCDACRDGTLIQALHTCKEDKMKLIDAYCGNILMLKDTIKLKYSPLIEHLISLLNIDEINKSQAEEYLSIIQEAEKKDFIGVLKEYFGISETKNSISRAIMHIFQFEE
jgi:hypothetical protein